MNGDGINYSGSWFQDHQTGGGILESPDGSRYEGETLLSCGKHLAEFRQFSEIPKQFSPYSGTFFPHPFLVRAASFYSFFDANALLSSVFFLIFQKCQNF